MSNTPSPLDVAKRLFPEAELKGLQDHELRRKVVVHKVGDSAARKPDAFIDAAFLGLSKGIMDGSMTTEKRAPSPFGSTPLTDAERTEAEAGLRAALAHAGGGTSVRDGQPIQDTYAQDEAEYQRTFAQRAVPFEHRKA